MMSTGAIYAKLYFAQQSMRGRYSPSVRPHVATSVSMPPMSSCLHVPMSSCLHISMSVRLNHPHVSTPPCLHTRVGIEDGVFANGHLQLGTIKWTLTHGHWRGSWGANIDNLALGHRALEDTRSQFGTTCLCDVVARARAKGAKQPRIDCRAN